MKKFICLSLACLIGATSVAVLSGCNDGNSTVKPGYVIEATEPDLKDGDFGFFILDQNQLIATKYSGNETDIVIPDSYDNYTVSAIGNSMFISSKIESVTMPDTVTKIGDYSFASCSQLKNVKLAKEIKSLGSNAFFNCPKLDSIELPEGIEDLGVYSLAGTGIKTVTIPKSVTELKESVFFQCRNLEEVYLPGTLTNIREDCFSQCSSNLTIKAPSGSYAESYAKENNFKFEATE